MINHKIANVPDEVCKKCSQLWEGDCRAYSVAHSTEEYEHRLVGEVACDKLRQERLANKVK